MHFCADELMVIIAVIPFARWLLGRIIWWRARYKCTSTAQPRCSRFASAEAAKQKLREPFLPDPV